MTNRRRALLAIATLMIIASLISACTQSLSQAPLVTPTLISDDLFVEPLPSAENPMAMIEEFAKQTAAAQTQAAGGDGSTTGTPGTPDPNVTANASTPQITSTVDANAGTSVTPTNANAAVTTSADSAITPSDNTLVNSTPMPPGTRPATYTLQAGEFPYCIARRFNVDPDALLSASGLTSPDVYYPGLTLKIPQSGAFPGDRMLASHPTTYTVSSASETLYSIACKYGDVDPNAIAAANSISAASKLTVGQTLQIP